MMPLSEMSATDRYKDEDGGLYGQGRNVPPLEYVAAAHADIVTRLRTEAQKREKGIEEHRRNAGTL